MLKTHSTLLLALLLGLSKSPLPPTVIAILAGRSVQQVLTLPGGVSSILRIDSTDKNQKSGS